MKNKTLSSVFIICCYCCAHSQTNNKVGFTTTNPTEIIDVNGTARVRDIPTNGNPNAIYTKPDGTVSTAKDQTFNATKTLVVDANGVVGSIDGIAITTAPTIKTIQYSRTSTTIDANTPTNSVTTMGNLSVRYAATDSAEHNAVQFVTAIPTHVTAFAQVAGGGEPTNKIFSNWKTTVSTGVATAWNPVSNQGLTPTNRDTYNAMVTLHNTQEIYRVSIICNGFIAASGGVPSVPAQVIIFIEKLQ